MKGSDNTDNADDDCRLEDSESEDVDFEKEESLLDDQPLHPVEVHFRKSNAPKNFWNRVL